MGSPPWARGGRTSGTEHAFPETSLTVAGKETSVEDRFSGDFVMQSGRTAGIAALIMAVYLLLAYGTYVTFTTRIPGGNDFYPRWRGTRALILEGRDPYSEEVTLEIQKAMYGRPARENEDQVAFAYPLYVSLLVLPFSLLPYPVAQAFWLSTLVLATLASLILILRTVSWIPSPLQLTGLALWSVLFYPTARSLVLGQLSILVLALLVLSLWAMRQGRPYLAGCSLALATIKPQIVFLVVPFLLLSSVRKARHRTLVGFLSVMAALVTITSMVLPSWIPSFIAGLTSYQSYTSIYREGRSPLGVLVGYFLPSEPASLATSLIAILLLAGLIYAWVVSLQRPDIEWKALTLTIVLTLILPAQTGTTNQVLLLLPMVYLLARWRTNRAMRLTLPAVLLIGPWILFVLTFFVRGGEHAMMSVPLPLFFLAILWWMPQERLV
jgi:hypothetical protein